MQSRLFHIALLIFFITNSFLGFSQNIWSEEILEKANTAKNADYLSDEEKAMIFYSNLVRLSPQAFKNTYLQHYIDSTHTKSKYVKSLIKTLEETKSMQPLLPSKDLYEIAKSHAKSFGKQGKTGHGNFKQRFSKYSKKCACAVGENCYYGNTNALNITIELLIDEGISSLSHREILLTPLYNHAGVAFSAHKVFEKSCVMDFSSATKD